MSVDEDHYTYPESPANLSAAEKQRVDVNLENLQKRLAAKCKHLVKGDPRPSKKWVRRAQVEKELQEIEERLAAAELEANGYID